MQATNVAGLATREVAELSGGQRQRVWAAMAIAQETPILLLDEPTTFLDLTHQIEMLDLFARLHRSGTTVVAVLHDLNQAARYATHLVVLKAGQVVATGAPAQVITQALVHEVFELNCMVIDDPASDPNTAGYDARLYDGSIVDWTRRRLPAVTGPQVKH